MIQKLVWKFNNFNLILESWYDDEKYYPYLIELWLNYPSIENLNKFISQEKLLEEKMDSFRINYKLWPSDIKSSFKSIIQQTKNTTVFEEKLINIFKNQHSEEDILIQSLIDEYLKKVDNDIPQKEKDIEENYKENAKIMAFNFIKTVICGILVEKGQDILFNKYRTFDASIQLSKSLNIDKTEELAKIVLNYYESDYYKCKRPKWLDKGHLDELVDKIKSKLKSRLEYIYDNKNAYAIHAILSFHQLVNTIKSLSQTYKDYNKIDNYKEELEKIVEDFNKHKKLGILPSNFEEALKIINNVLEKIEKDVLKLKNFIKKIYDELKRQDESKNQTFSRTIFTGGLGVSSLTGTIVCSGGGAIYFGALTILNIFTTLANIKDYKKKIEIMDELNKLYEKAIKENKRMHQDIEDIFLLLKGKKTLDIPKY